jgi:hypothetical protein
MKNKAGLQKVFHIGGGVALRGAAWLCCFVVFSSFGQRAGAPSPKPVHSDLTLLQCGNLIYAGSQSSVCFADNFLSDVAAQTNLRVNKTFCSVRLDAEALFDYPFCVISGNQSFSLTKKEREQLRKYLTQGGFLRTVSLDGLEINGRLVLVYSKEGLNDVRHASGCCCCGGNEIESPARVNVNVFTYAALY